MTKKTKIITTGFAVILLIALVSVFWRSQEAAAPVNQTSQATDANTSAADAPAAPGSSFDKKKYATSEPASPWVVVNKTRPLSPVDYAPADLVSVGSGQRMRSEAAAALKAMINAAKAGGLTLTAVSAYRSYDYQKTVYGNEVSSYGQAVADSESARPGYSEHQTGLAVDIGGGGCNIDDCFGDTAEGKWADANAYKYGFLLRYTDAKTGVTGYRGESWHFRYIGVQLSEEMHEQNVVTLEEFFGLPAAPDYKN